MNTFKLNSIESRRATLIQDSQRSFRTSQQLNKGKQFDADLYDILGITSAASDKEIKRAFLMKAKQFHPDVNKSADAPKKFSTINEAYETLGNEQKRRVYDATGMSSNDQQNANQRGDFGFNPFGFAFSAFRKGGQKQEQTRSFEEILKEFEQFFDMNETTTNSQGPQSKKAKGVIKGRDIQQNVAVSFKESALGCSKDISFARNENCGTCDGSGAKPGIKETKCTVCNGSGHIVEQMNQVTMVQIECEDCEGMGTTVPACLACSGIGSVRSKVTETVTIPAGVYSGLVLRSQGKGNQMRKGIGQPGDLLLKVKVEDHETFKREAENVLSEAQIPFTKAVFGGDVSVETLKGESKITLQPGTQDGTKSIIKGAGMQKVTKSGSLGDHIVTLRIEVPTELNSEQEKALQKFAQLYEK